MKSPTTTNFDRDIIAKTAEFVGVNPVEYGMSIFKCRSNPAELPVDKIVNADAKEFELSNGNKVYIGQFETVDLQAVLGREAEIREAIKALVAEKGYQFVLFFATDILAEGSQFICEGDTEFVNKVFGIDVTGKSVWMPGVLSRKKLFRNPFLKRCERTFWEWVAAFADESLPERSPCGIVLRSDVFDADGKALRCEFELPLLGRPHA